MGAEVPGSQAVERALDLLSAFGAQDPAFSLSELSERVGLTPSTTRRLLKALMAKGYIEQDPLSRRYRLGMQLTRLGRIAEVQSDLSRSARDPLERLVADLGEAAYLVRLAGAEIIYLMVVHSPDWVRLTAEVGQTFPAWATASGRVLLAEKSDEEIRALYPDPIPVFLGRYSMSTDELIAELARIREQGYATHTHDREDDVFSVAAPIFDGSGTAQVALTVSGPAFRFRESGGVAPRVRRVANEISYRISGNDRSSRYSQGLA